MQGRQSIYLPVPRTMILIDPDLDPAPTPHGRNPSARALTRFLAVAQAAVRLRGEVSVLLTTDRNIRRLNREYRGKDKATDVLSFPASPFIRSPEIGDLAISVDTARTQAAEQGHALTCELQVLILHGLLHLAGCDHEADRGEMERRERQLRARLGLPLGLIERASHPAASRTTRTNRTRAKVVKK